ncbi:MAG: signal peptide peptidase SppA [Planctomycetota bacterium]
MTHLLVIPRLALVAALLGLLLTGCNPPSLVIGLAPAQQKLKESAVETDGRTSNKIALINVSGTLFNADRPGLLTSGPNPVAQLHEQLNRAADDGRVKAVVLRINSPGGGVTASDLMYRQVQRFKQTTGKPVVVCLMDVAASGGYYLACAGDHLVAHPSTVTGSIGVIAQLLSLKPALDRLGITATTLTSGPNKSAGSPFDTLTDDQQAVLQTLVDTFYDDFKAVVREARPGVAEADWDKVTDGRVVTGRDALALGLVDSLGDLYTAWDTAKSLANVDRAKLIRYHSPLRRVTSPYASAPQPNSPQLTQINLAQFNLHAGLDQHLPVGFYYLWSPAAQLSK